MKECIYEVIIKPCTPLHIASGISEGGALDKYVVKDLMGNPYLPGSTIKGKLRDNFFKLVNICENTGNDVVGSMFGTGGYNPSKIYIEDFYAIYKGSQAVGVKLGISLDRYRKTSEDKALYSYETVWASGFIGKVTVYFDNETLVYKDYLEMAFRMIESIGSSKSRGHGRVTTSIREVTV